MAASCTTGIDPHQTSHHGHALAQNLQRIGGSLSESSSWPVWHHRTAATAVQCSLHIGHTRDPVQQDLVLFSFGGQLCRDEGLCQLCVTSPHHSIRVDSFRSRGQTRLDAVLRNSMVERDATMGLNLLVQDPVHNQHLWRASRNANGDSLLQSGVSRHQRVQTQAEEQKHERVALLSSLTMWDHLGVAHLEFQGTWS